MTNESLNAYKTIGGLKMHTAKLNHLGLTAIAVMILAVVGCGASAGGHDIANLGGTWQNPSNQEKVVINVAGEKKTISIADKTLPLTVKPAEADRFVFHVSDTGSGEKDWNVFRVWDDTGKSFTLKLEHDGQTDNLERVKG
jgi:hypothetical protein